MIRHISMFQMEPKPKNGKTVEENVKDLVAFLEKLPEQEPSIAGCRWRPMRGSSRMCRRKRR